MSLKYDLIALLSVWQTPRIKLCPLLILATAGSSSLRTIVLSCVPQEIITLPDSKALNSKRVPQTVKGFPIPGLYDLLFSFSRELLGNKATLRIKMNSHALPAGMIQASLSKLCAPQIFWTTSPITPANLGFGSEDYGICNLAHLEVVDPGKAASEQSSEGRSITWLA